uniref:beta/gamma crystallin-related protein n=1 Tax=Phenylobacterium sp. TaxID=1871053 RepID=UPI00286CDB59
MKRLFILATAAIALTGGSAVAQADLRGASPPPGDYWRTCQNVSTYGFGRDAVVSAQCRDSRGRLQSTSLRFDGCGEIDNRNGQLVCIRGDGGGGGRPPWGGGDGGGRPPWDGGDGGGRPPWGGGGRSSITIYGAPDYRRELTGSNREITNLPRQYNDRAMSLRIEGRGSWQVCSDKDFRGRCQIFDRSVPDLRSYGLGEAVTSMR